MTKWIKEVEVRFPVANFDAIRAKLIALNGEKRSDATELVRFYDTPQMIYDSTGTRIRIKTIGTGARAELQKKEAEPTASMPNYPERKMKVRIEHAAEVFDTLQEAEAYAAEQFPGVEVRQDWTYSKHREHWVLPDSISVELDTLEEIDRRYVEIEGAPQQIQQLVEAFDLNWSTSVVQSYRSEHVEARRA